MKKTFKLLLCVVLMCFAVSCELTLPTISDSGTIPYQRPDTPQNVKVLSGNKDRIVITWDPVENASYYVVEGAVSSDFGDRFSVFGNTTTTKFELDKGSEIRTDRSYIFTVRAVTRFGNGKSFASLNSEYVEGSLAPEAKDIQFYSVVTNDTVTAYWNIPTLFSTLHGKDVLYTADFTLGYKLKDAAEWTTIAGKDVSSNPDVPWMFHQIDINSSQMVQNEEYLFRIGVDITDETGGEKTQIFSNPITLLMHSDKLPSAIPELKVTSDSSIDFIDLSWDVPDWTLPVSADNVFFKLERKEVGTENWIEVFNELRKDGERNDQVVRSVNEDTGRISVTYKDVHKEGNDLRGKKFIYRITNGAFADKVLYIQEDKLTESAEASLFMPDVTKAGVEWSQYENPPTKAGVKCIYEIANADAEKLASFGLHPVFVAELYTPETLSWEVLRDMETQDWLSYSKSHSYEVYRFFFELRNAENESYMERIPVTVTSETADAMKPVPGLEGLYPILGNHFPADKPFVENVTASNDRNQKIVVKFDEVRYTDPRYSGAYKYEAGVVGGKLEVITPVEVIEAATAEDGTTRRTMEFSLDTANASERIIIKVTSGAYIYSPAVVEGSVLAPPAGIELKTSSADGKTYDFTWNTGATVTPNCSYLIAYRASGVEKWTNGDVVTFDSGKASMDLSALPAGTYQFAFAARNDSYIGEGEAYGTAFTEARIIAPVEGINASKGAYKDRIALSWNALDGAEGYRIYRYENDITTAEKIGEVASDVLSYDDADVVADSRYYVTAFIGGIEGRHDVEFAMIANPIGNPEESNLGYVFGDVKLGPVTKSHLDAGHHLKPYFTVEFTPVKFASKYVVSATDPDTKYEFDLSTFTPSGSVRSNGRNAEEVGYAEYDPATGLARANVAFNILDKEYKVESVAVTASNGTDSSVAFPSVGTARRAFGAVDYVNLFVPELKKVISAANSQFGGDWYTYPQSVYEGTGVRIGSTWAELWQDNGYVGHMRFNGYKGDLASLDTVTQIELVSTNGGGAGYLGTDPLNTLGTNYPGNSTKIKPNMKLQVDGVDVVFEEAVISVGISKYPGWSGNYNVSIAGREAVTISINDARIDVKPY